MPYQLFDYIPDSTIHTMGQKPQWAGFVKPKPGGGIFRPPPPAKTMAAMCFEDPKFCAPPGQKTTMALGEENPGGSRKWPCPQRLPGC